MILFIVYKRAGLRGTWLPSSKEKKGPRALAVKTGDHGKLGMQMLSAKNQIRHLKKFQTLQGSRL